MGFTSRRAVASRAAAAPADAPRRRLWRRLGDGAVDAVLWALGVIGLLSLIAAVVAHIWGYSIILFSTGSMTPTIPAGSAALVQRVPAGAVHVGDIVTIERKDALPVTHRVTSIAPATDGSGQFVITMRGDANPTDDASPYRVSEVRRVVFSVPGVAIGIARLRDPRLLAALTVVAGALVTWAFWPRRGAAVDDDAAGLGSEAAGAAPGPDLEE